LVAFSFIGYAGKIIKALSVSHLLPSVLFIFFFWLSGKEKKENNKGTFEELHGGMMM